MAHLHNQPTAPNFPKPLKQGQLDRLCGIYAVINATRNACFTLAPRIHFSSEILFKSIVADLTGQGQAAQLLAGAQGRPQVEAALRVAQGLLHEGFRVHLTLSGLAPGPEDASAAFNQIRQHLEKPGTSALLRFCSQTHIHWTVIRDIRAGKLIPSDSAWFKPMALSGFELEMLPLRQKRYCFEEEDVLLLSARHDRPSAAE